MGLSRLHQFVQRSDSASSTSIGPEFRLLQANYKYQISNIISRHASGMPLSKIPWKQCVYSISYLTYLFALTEMHFLSQKLEHAWLRKCSCWVVLSCRTRIRNAINEFLEQANVKTSCNLKCGSSGGKHHQTPVLVFIFFPRLKMIMLLGSGCTMYCMVATACLSSNCLSHNSSQFSKLLVRTDRSCSPLPSWFGWGECFRIF